jgi:hypothetical protein
MAFFSWFKSKSGSSKGDEHGEDPFSKPLEADAFAAARDIPPGPGIPRLRETIPHSARPLPGSPTFRRPVRATVDIPLQTLWQSLPQGLAKENPSFDPRRRIPIPRKEVRINDADHTGIVNIFVLHAVCPEIFGAPIQLVDHRSVRFPLPAWERLRNAEVLEVKTAPILIGEPANQSTESQAGEDPDSSEKDPKAESETAINPKLSEGHHSPSTSESKAQTTDAKPKAADITQNLRLALLPILRNLPSELGRPTIQSAAASNAEIELPYDLIRPQLANGRVSVPISVFLQATPEAVRNAFGKVDQSAQVPIPLKEIFRHLPSDALPLRTDQEMDEIDESIGTPFSSTAKEDAERFHGTESSSIESKTGPAPTEFSDPAAEQQIEASKLPVETPEAPSQAQAETSEPVAVSTAKPKPDFSALQSVFLTEERLDLPLVITKISTLPGLQASLLHTVDGRQLGGTIGNDQFERAALALFPALFCEAKTKLDEKECVGLETLTLCWGQEQISIFSDGRLCLSVRHTRRPFKPGVREKLSLIFSRLTEALSPSGI